MAELRAIEGVRSKPVAAVVEVLREQLARAEAGGPGDDPPMAADDDC